jgi:hypothetical protein
MESAPRFPHPHTPSDHYERASNAASYLVQKTARIIEHTFPICLFTVAVDVVVPVHKRALRVIAPGPDVEFEE